MEVNLHIEDSRRSVITTKPTILYIEDDPASRSLVERTLRHAGYNVLVAECGLQGIDLARSELPDLILTDINLPDLSGREITTTLRGEAHFQKTPIVALTAQIFNEQRELTMAAGITGYLTKPVDIEALPGQIEYYLHGGYDMIESDRLSDAQTRYMQEVVGRLEQRIRQLETTNSTLRKLDKMKDSFIQLTAHELRTPLTLVYGYSRLLEDSPSLKIVMQQDEGTQTLMKGLIDAITRMQGIINEVLTISRIMTHQIDLSIALVSPAATVQKAISSYQQAISDRQMNLHFDPTAWPDRIRADADLLELTMNNLISNAVKYTPNGGHITISGQADAQHMRISVKDSGIGVARDDQERIFERFHTAGDTMLHSTSKTAYRGGGLGLGLAICKGIVEAHNGRIWVESQGFDADKLPGSEFIVSLPLTVQRKDRP
jgi:signal transduction histidine kinase